MQVAALFGAAFIGFLLGGLLMFLLISGRGDEDHVEQTERSEAARGRADREREAADHVQLGADGRGSALASAAAGSQTPGRVDA